MFDDDNAKLSKVSCHQVVAEFRTDPKVTVANGYITTLIDTVMKDRYSKYTGPRNMISET